MTAIILGAKQNFQTINVIGCPSDDSWNLTTPVFAKLHWLPVSSRITNKIAILTHKTISTSKPGYLHYTFHRHVPSIITRSANQNSRIQPDIRNYRSDISRRGFTNSAPPSSHVVGPRLRFFGQPTDIWPVTSCLLTYLGYSIMGPGLKHTHLFGVHPMKLSGAYNRIE